MAHACQPASSTLRDTQFPAKYIQDPWCWSPETGFHRSSSPETERFPRLSKGTRLLSADSIDAAQAFRLGLGIGTGMTSLTGNTSRAVFSMLALSRLHHYAGDPDLWAQLGAAAVGRTWIDQDRSQIARLMRLMLSHYVGSQACAAPLPLIKTITGAASETDRTALEADSRTAAIAGALLDTGRSADCTADIVRLFATEETKIPSKEIDAMIRDVIDLLDSLPAEERAAVELAA